MKLMARIAAAIIAVCLFAGLLAGCGTGMDENVIFSLVGEANGTVTVDYTGNAVALSPAFAKLECEGLGVVFTYFDSENNELSAPPVDAGTYKVRASLSADGYTGTHEATLIIRKQQVAVQMEDCEAFCGEDFEVFCAPPVIGGQALPVTLTYDGQKAKPTAAGTYTVKGEIEHKNYQGENTAELVLIEPNAEQAGKISVSGGGTFVYDGTKKSLSCVIHSAEITHKKTEYKGKGDTVYDSETAPKDIGSYTAIVTYTEVETGEESQLTRTISIRAAELSLNESYDYIYDGQPHQPEISSALPVADFSLVHDGTAGLRAHTLPGIYTYTVTTSNNVRVNLTSFTVRVLFNNAFAAYQYGEAYFNNCTDLASEFRGIATATFSKEKQNNCSVRYKSSNPASTVGFYYRNANYSQIVAGKDPTFSIQTYIPKNSGTFSYRSNASFLDSGKISVAGEYDETAYNGGTLNVAADIADQTLNENVTRADYKTAWGVAHDGFSGYIVDENTIEDGKDASISLNDQNQYTFSFSFNSGVHADYKIQIAKFSRETYDSFLSLTLSFVMNASGQIIRIQTIDSYKLHVFLYITVKTNGIETITYNTVDNVINENGLVTA